MLPNKALADKKLMRTTSTFPYLDKRNQEKGYKIVNAGKFILEPMGIYSKKYKSKRLTRWRDSDYE